MVTQAVPHVINVCSRAEGLVRFQSTRVPQVLGLALAFGFTGLAREAAIVLVVAGALLFLWWRRGRFVKWSAIAPKIYRLCEDLSADGPDRKTVGLLRQILPKALRATDAYIYLYDQSSGGLRRLDSGEPTGETVVVNEFSKAAAWACLKNRSLLIIPETRKSPFFTDHMSSAAPRSAMFVPMFAWSEIVGVLVVEDSRSARRFSRAEQEIVQHLANQTAIGIKLRERSLTRSRLLCNEKFTAANQLVTAVAAELKRPLDAIEASASRLRDAVTARGDLDQLYAMTAALRRASSAVGRLLAVTDRGPGERESEMVDVAALLRNLIKARVRVWQEHNIACVDLLPREPVFVEGPAYPLEQVLLSLLSHAEHGAEKAADKKITLRARDLAGNIVVEIAYSSPITDPREDQWENGDPEDGVLSLGVCQAILRWRGGDLRRSQALGQEARLEVTLPAIAQGSAAPTPGSGAARMRLTILLIEPDAAMRRHILAMLSERGHRAVAVASAEEALEFAQRFGFHAVFCAAHLSGKNCFASHEKIRSLVSHIVLLGETFDPDLLRGANTGEHFLRTNPLDAEDLDRILAALQSRQRVGAGYNQS